jgi:hypothetical protein
LDVDDAGSSEESTDSREVLLREDAVGRIDAIELSNVDRPEFVDEKTIGCSAPAYK